MKQERPNLAAEQSSCHSGQHELCPGFCESSRAERDLSKLLLWFCSSHCQPYAFVGERAKSCHPSEPSTSGKIPELGLFSELLGQEGFTSRPTGRGAGMNGTRTTRNASQWSHGGAGWAQLQPGRRAEQHRWETWHRPCPGSPWLWQPRPRQFCSCSILIPPRAFQGLLGLGGCAALALVMLVPSPPEGCGDNPPTPCVARWPQFLPEL